MVIGQIKPGDIHPNKSPEVEIIIQQNKFLSITSKKNISFGLQFIDLQ